MWPSEKGHWGTGPRVDKQHSVEGRLDGIYRVKPNTCRWGQRKNDPERLIMREGLARRISVRAMQGQRLGRRSEVTVSRILRTLMTRRSSS